MSALLHREAILCAEAPLDARTSALTSAAGSAPLAEAGRRGAPLQSSTRTCGFHRHLRSSALLSVRWMGRSYYLIHGADRVLFARE